MNLKKVIFFIDEYVKINDTIRLLKLLLRTEKAEDFAFLLVFRYVKTR